MITKKFKRWTSGLNPRLSRFHQGSKLLGQVLVSLTRSFIIWNLKLAIDKNNYIHWVAGSRSLQVCDKTISMPGSKGEGSDQRAALCWLFKKLVERDAFDRPTKFQNDLPSVWYPRLRLKMNMFDSPYRLTSSQIFAFETLCSLFLPCCRWLKTLTSLRCTLMPERLQCEVDYRRIQVHEQMAEKQKKNPAPNQLGFLSKSAATTEWGLGQTGPNKLLSPFGNHCHEFDIIWCYQHLALHGMLKLMFAFASNDTLEYKGLKDLKGMLSSLMPIN